MPLFGQTSTQKFTPKTAKFNDIYKKASGYKEMSDTAKREIIEALQQAGMRDDKINTVLNDQDLSPEQLKKIVTHLNKAEVSGFGSNPTTLVQSHFRSEAIKAKNIARVRKEYMQEALKENLDGTRLSSAPTTKSSNTAGAGKPKLPF